MKGLPNRRNPKLVLRVASAPPAGAGNVLVAYLRAHRWVKEEEVMTWLYREHRRLIGEVVLARDLEAHVAVEAMELVRARLGQRRRWRGR